MVNEPSRTQQVLNFVKYTVYGHIDMRICNTYKTQDVCDMRVSLLKANVQPEVIVQSYLLYYTLPP